MPQSTGIPTTAPAPVAPPSGTLTFGQIEALWISNGGDPAWAPTMAGIALAESGGNTTSLNNNPGTGDYSVGLWQINYYANLLGPRTAAYGSPAALQSDSNAQAKAAIDLLGGGGGISAWLGDKVGNSAQGGNPLPLSTVEALVAQNGLGSVADAFDPAGKTPAQIAQLVLAIPGGSLPIIGPIISGVNAAGSAAQEFATIATKLSSYQFWLRVGEFALGLGLLVGGLALFVATSKEGEKAIGTAADVAPLLAA